jgi:hypothetical protein
MLRKSVRIFSRIKRLQEMVEATIEANPTDPTVLREHLTQLDAVLYVFSSTTLPMGLRWDRHWNRAECQMMEVNGHSSQPPRRAEKERC